MSVFCIERGVNSCRGVWQMTLSKDDSTISLIHMLLLCDLDIASIER